MENIMTRLSFLEGAPAGSWRVTREMAKRDHHSLTSLKRGNLHSLLTHSWLQLRLSRVLQISAVVLTSLTGVLGWKLKLEYT